MARMAWVGRERPRCEPRATPHPRSPPPPPPPRAPSRGARALLMASSACGARAQIIIKQKAAFRSAPTSSATMDFAPSTSKQPIGQSGCRREPGNRLACCTLKGESDGRVPHQPPPAGLQRPVVIQELSWPLLVEKDDGPLLHRRCARVLRPKERVGNTAPAHTRPLPWMRSEDLRESATFIRR
eukprot:COSAG04_NODE_952_length_9209_cov_4.865093_8_plen_184_part_00